MSRGLYIVVDAIVAIGAAATAADREVVQLLEDAQAADAAVAQLVTTGAETTSERTGGAGGGAGGRGASPGGSPGEVGRTGRDGAAKFGTVTVRPLDAPDVITALKSLEGR